MTDMTDKSCEMKDKGSSQRLRSRIDDSLSDLRAKQLQEIARRREISINDLLIGFVADECKKFGIVAFRSAYSIDLMGDTDGYNAPLLLVQVGELELTLTWEECYSLRTLIREVLARRSATKSMRWIFHPTDNGSVEIARCRHGLDVTGRVVKSKKKRVRISSADALSLANNLEVAAEAAFAARDCANPEKSQEPREEVPQGSEDARVADRFGAIT